MTKRRRSEDILAELAEAQEYEVQATVSAEGTTVGQTQLRAVPAVVANTITESEGHQLVGLDAADVARDGAASPRRIAGVVPSQSQTAVNEEGSTGELELPNHEHVLASRLSEEEADVAGQDPAEPHWF